MLQLWGVQDVQSCMGVGGVPMVLLPIIQHQQLSQQLHQASPDGRDCPQWSTSQSLSMLPRPFSTTPLHVWPAGI